MLTPYLLSVAAFASTFLGGLVVLHSRRRLHLILAFSAGAVLGVAFFDLLPEALELAGDHYGITAVTSVVAAGFLFFMLMNQWILLHPHTVKDEDHCENPRHQKQVGAAALAVHSLMDGIAIGLAFQVSPTVGAVVATAVLVHDFSDGVNTVSLALKNKADRAVALRWLIADALAPMAGVLIAQTFTLSEPVLGLTLAAFCGFFLYIGASDLLPESHHHHPKFQTSLVTVAGAAVLFIAVRLAGV